MVSRCKPRQMVVIFDCSLVEDTFRVDPKLLCAIFLKLHESLCKLFFITYRKMFFRYNFHRNKKLLWILRGQVYIYKYIYEFPLRPDCPSISCQKISL
jgi:hypothetical protein